MSEYIKPRKEFIPLYEEGNVSDLIKYHKVGVEYNISLNKKLTQQETIIAKLTEALEKIDNHLRKSQSLYIRDRDLIARKVLQDIKDMK